MKLIDKIKESYKEGKDRAIRESMFESEMRVVRVGFNNDGTFKDGLGESGQSVATYCAMLARSDEARIRNSKASGNMLDRLAYHIGYLTG